MQIEKLKTVQNFSKEYGYSTTYIYKLLKAGVLKAVDIDGVTFVDTERIPKDFKKKR
jgi:hypothetical protein